MPSAAVFWGRLLEHHVHPGEQAKYPHVDDGVLGCAGQLGFPPGEVEVQG